MHASINTILISGLRLNALIGTNPEERVHPQAIQLDIQLGVDTRLSAESDQIAHAVNYAKVVERLQYWTQQSQFFLIEALAHFLVEQLIKEFPIQKIQLKLSKFPADIPADSVGIIIEY